MQISYVQKSDLPRLLLIYSGWSIDASFFKDVQCPGYDIAVVFGYDTFEPVSLPEEYDEVALIAWSLGVHAAELTAANLPLTLTVAVNGTPYPVDAEKGISPEIFYGTAANLSEASLAKFRRRMGAAGAARGVASIEELKSELQRFPTEPVAFRWDKAVISAGDRIFPPANQLRAWSQRAEIIEIEGSHTPDFQNIIDRFVINKQLVTSRFSRGQQSYDEASDVQQRIADHLFALWQKYGITDGRVLEVGVGTGYFTRLYINRVHDAVLWDITPCAKEVVCTDAEVAIQKVSGQFDAIVSASAVQWFNSLAAFLLRCVPVVREGGLIALSTFGPKTFGELTQAGVIPLPYPSEDTLRRIVPPQFRIRELHSGLITRKFNSPVDVLAHLKATGVNARSCACSIRELIRRYPADSDGRYSLTYQPVYLILERI